MNKLLETVDLKGFVRPTLSLNFQLERAKTVPRNNLNICQEANLFKEIRKFQKKSPGANRSEAFETFGKNVKF